MSSSPVSGGDVSKDVNEVFTTNRLTTMGGVVQLRYRRASCGCRGKREVTRADMRKHSFTTADYNELYE